MITVWIEHKLNEEMMCNLLIAAIEGGSNYWCDQILKIAGPKENEEFDVVWYGQSEQYEEGSKLVIQVVEADPHTEDGKPGCDGRWFVSIDKMRNAFQLMAEYGTPKGWHLQNVIKEDWDAETADVWLQLATFGEVVYG